MADASPKFSICDPELRDVWTKIIPFIANPGPLRGCSGATVEIWDHTLYLEGELPCPYVIIASRSRGSKRTTCPLIPGAWDLKRLQPGDQLVFQRIPGLEMLPKEMWQAKMVPKWKRTIESSDRVPIRAMSRIHLCELPSLKEIAEKQFQAIATLVEVVIEDLPELRKIGRRAVFRCHNIKRLVIRRLPKLVDFDDHLLEECGGDGVEKEYWKAVGDSNMDEVIFEDLPSLVLIPSCTLYLSASADLMELAKGFPSLTKIDDFFMYRNIGVRHAKIEGLPELETIGRTMLKAGAQLETVRLHRLPKLTSIGIDFCQDCPVLRLVEIVDLLSLETFSGGGWFNKTDNLQELVFRNLPKLTSISLAGVNSLAGDRKTRGKLVLEKLPVLSTVVLSNLSNPSWKLVAEEVPKLDIEALAKLLCINE